MARSIRLQSSVTVRLCGALSVQQCRAGLIFGCLLVSYRTLAPDFTAPPQPAIGESLVEKRHQRKAVETPHLAETQPLAICEPESDRNLTGPRRLLFRTRRCVKI